MEERDYLDPGAAMGLCPIAVMEIVHGGKYWVSEPSGIHMSKEREAVVLLETRLAEKMGNQFEIVKDIPENKLIAVKNEATGCWHRGKLLSPMPQSSTSRSRVFLVDHGEFLGNVKINHLQPLPEDMQDLAPQAFVVCLYGLIPLTVDVQLEDVNDKFHFERNAIWTTASEIFAQEMLESSSSAYLSGIRVEGRTVHGEIFFNIEDRRVSLNKELCRKKFAYYCEEAYEKVINHEINVEKRMKMTEEALMEAARLEYDKAQLRSDNYKNLKHILMEDFMKEYVCKKLLRQEKVARTLDEIRQDTGMEDVQATDEKTRKALEAEILSSASRSLGRASILRRKEEGVDVSLPKGRGLPSAAAGRTRAPFGPSARLVKSSHNSLLSLLDSVSCKPKENPSEGDNGEASPTTMIPAGYPIEINDPNPKKKKKNGRRGAPEVESVGNSGSPLINEEDLEMSNVSRSSISPETISSARRNKSFASGIINNSSNSKMIDDFVQMRRLYAQGSPTTAGASEWHEENKATSSVGIHKMPVSSEEKTYPEVVVANGQAQISTAESRLKSLIVSHSEGAVALEDVEIQSKSKEKASPEVVVLKGPAQITTTENRLKNLIMSRLKGAVALENVEMQSNSVEKAFPEVVVPKGQAQISTAESRLKSLIASQSKGAVALENVEIQSNSDEKASPEVVVAKAQAQITTTENRLKNLIMSRSKGAVALENVEMQSNFEKKASPEVVPKGPAQISTTENRLKNLIMSRSKGALALENVEMKSNSVEKASPGVVVAKGQAQLSTTESRLKNLMMSRSKGFVASENVVMQSKTGVPVAEPKNVHHVDPAISGAEKIHCITALKQKSDASMANGSESISSKELNLSERENVASKSRKEKSVNPLFSLLEMIKKKKKVSSTCDEIASIPCDQEDSDVSVGNMSSKIEGHCSSIQFPSSQGEHNVQSTNLSDNVSYKPKTKRLIEYPLHNQACSIPSPTSEIESEQHKGSRSSSQKKCSISIFSAGEWNNSDLIFKENRETQLLESFSSVETDNKLMKLSTLSVEDKYLEGQGSCNMNSSDVCLDSSVEAKDVACKVILPDNSEHRKPKAVTDTEVNSESSGFELKVHLPRTEVMVPKSVSLAPLHDGGKAAAYQDENRRVVAENELSHASGDHLRLNESDSEECTSATITPKCAGDSEPSYHCSSSKPGFSSSVERFFKIFHSRKHDQGLRAENGSSKLSSGDKQKNDSVNVECTSSLSGDFELQPSKEKFSESKLKSFSKVNETESKQVSTVISSKSEIEVCDLENVDASKGDIRVTSEVTEDLSSEAVNGEYVPKSSVEKEQGKERTESSHVVSSDSVSNENQASLSDESISREIREVHSLAQSLSKIEAEKNSKMFDAIKSKGVSLQNISVRLPLIAAQEKITVCKNVSLPEAPVISNGTSRVQVSAPVGKMEEVEKHKTLEPEAVKPLSVGQPALPHLLSASWMPDPLGGDCLLTAHRIKMSRVLVRGHLLAQPIQSIAQAPFKEVLHEAFSKMGYRDPMRIQTYAWPALMRGHNLIMVNPPRSGKTLAYLLPLISFMLSPDLYTEVPEGNGPLVLILCPSWNVVAQINDYCLWLLENVHTPTRIIPVYGGMEEQQMIPLINGCEILITTPRCLLRIIGRSRIITNFDRLCHLVFDEADTMMKKFLPEVKQILKECQLLLRKRARLAAESNPSGDSDSYQVVKFIAAAKTWCPQMESFVKNIIEKPLLLIGSYLEAAVFSQLKPTLHIVGYQDCIKLTPSKSDCRIEEVDNVVLAILKKSLGFERFVVACESVDDVRRLAPKIIELGANLLVVHEHQLHFDIAETRHTWLCSQLSGALPVLLISDGTLSEFNIGDAEHLVHVGVPTNSKTRFGLRFSTLMDNYRDIFSKEGKKKNCSADIVVDINQPDLEIFGLIEFLQRLGISVPPELEGVASKSLLRKEMMKKDLLLCPEVKSFGECDTSACKYRHAVLPNVDQPSEGLPKCGTVRVKVLHVLNVSQITARLLEHINPDGTKVPYPNDYFHIAAGLARHFRNPGNIMLHGTPKVGDMCAIESGHNLYQRALVTSVVQKKWDNPNSVAVSVNLVDEGTTKTVKAYQLVHLPDEYKGYPPQAKELIICRMMPRDLDTTWSKAASVKVAELLEQAADGELEGKEIIGEVVLTLGSTLWVDPLECREWLEKMRTTIIHISIRRDLLSLGLAVDNPDHVQKLIKLCNAVGFALPETRNAPESPQSMPNEPCDEPDLSNVDTKPDDHTMEIIWESLSFDKLIDVNVIAVESPACFKVQKVSVADELFRLSEDIQLWITTVHQNPENGNQEYAIGSICIAFCSADDSWCRAKVLSSLKSFKTAINHGDSETTDKEIDIGQEEEIHYEVYFVDYGDTATVSSSQMVPINETLMQLPFQAIECSLLGVKPIREEFQDSSKAALDTWDDDASDAFFNLCRDKDDVDLYRPLLAKVFGTEGRGSHGGLKNLVVLYDKHDERVRKIGEALVEQGFAEACQVIVDGEPEDDVSMDLESHWFGEKALIPFTPALRDSVDLPSLQCGDTLDKSNEATMCNQSVQAQGEKTADKNEFRGADAKEEIDDDDDDSSSFELVMTDEEVKMYEEKLRRFLGIPPRHTVDGAQPAGNNLKPIAYKETSADDHSSIGSYEIISESSSHSVGKFEELTMDEAVQLEKSGLSPPNASDTVEDGESDIRKIESDCPERLLERVNFPEGQSGSSSPNVSDEVEGSESGSGKMESDPSKTLPEREKEELNSSACPGRERLCLEMASKENEKSTVGNADGETAKVEMDQIEVDKLVKCDNQNLKKTSSLEVDSCVIGSNLNPCTHLILSDSTSVREQNFEEFTDEEVSKSSPDAQCNLMSPENENHHRECRKETEVSKETDVFTLVNVLSQGSGENADELEVCTIDKGEKELPPEGLVKNVEDQNACIAVKEKTVSPCSYSENINEHASSLNNPILSKRIALSFPAMGHELDFSPIFATEICGGLNTEGVSHECQNDMNLESKAILPVVLNKRDNSQVPPKLATDGDLSEEDSLESDEIIVPDSAHEEATVRNQVSKDIPESNLSFMSSVNYVADVDESNERCPPSKLIPDCDFMKEKSLNTFQGSVVDCYRPEAFSGIKVPKDTSESDVNSELVEASSESDNSQFPPKFVCDRGTRKEMSSNMDEKSTSISYSQEKSPGWVSEDISESELVESSRERDDTPRLPRSVSEGSCRKDESLNIEEANTSVCEDLEKFSGNKVSKDKYESEVNSKLLEASDQSDKSLCCPKLMDDNDFTEDEPLSVDETKTSVCGDGEESSGCKVSTDMSECDINSELLEASNECDNTPGPPKSVHEGYCRKEGSLNMDEANTSVCGGHVDLSVSIFSKGTSESDVIAEMVEASDGSDTSLCPSKVVHDGDVREGESLNMDTTVCGSQEESPDNEVSPDMSEIDLNSESVCSSAVNSNKENCIRSVFKSLQDSHLSKEDSLNLSESAEVNCPKDISIDLTDLTKDINMDLAHNPSEECNDSCLPAANESLDQRQGEAEVVINQQLAEGDMLVGEFCRDQGNDPSIEDCHEPNSYDNMPPLVRARIPQVKWIQNKWEVNLTVELPDMKKYSIHWMSNKHLYLHASSGRSDGNCFALELPLWASINTEESVHMPISNSTVKLILPKGLASVEWPRLLSSPVKPLWLSVDFDQLVVDGDEESDERPFQVINYRSSDDESNSEDEGPDTGVRYEEVNYDPYDPFS